MIAWMIPCKTHWCIFTCMQYEGCLHSLAVSCSKNHTQSELPCPVDLNKHALFYGCKIHSGMHSAD
jgi:hypothetical protein